MTELRIDPAASRLVLRTRAVGVLARLAHDLEIAAAALQGHARLDDASWTAELLIPTAHLTVAGALRGERLDPSALSANDRQQIENRMRDDVLCAATEVRIEASGRSRERAEARVIVSSGAATVSAPLRVAEAPGGGLTVSGSCQLSLRALGIPEIKGPMGAFKIRDDLEIRFDLTLLPPA